MARYFEVSEQSKAWLEEKEAQEGMTDISGTIPTELLSTIKELMIAHTDKKPHGG